MDITKEQIDDVNAVVRIKLTPEDYKPAVEKLLKEHSKKISMPGFRPGKVPFGMVKKMYGKSVMAEEINRILADSLTNYLTENNIEILGDPLPKAGEKIDWDNPQEIEFSYELGLAPKFSLNLDPGLEFDYHTVQVDEDMIDKQVEDLRKQYGKFGTPEISTEKDIISGDFAELDESGNIKEEGIAKSSTIVVERIKDEETRKALTGVKTGDSVVVNSQKLTDNATDLSAMLGIEKQAAEELNSNFQFTVKNITHIEPAELNQEFFDKVYGVGKVTSEEEFRKKVSGYISNMFQNDVDNRLLNEITNYFIENTEITLPDQFLKKWIEAVSKNPVSKEQIEADYDNYVKGIKWQLIENRIFKEQNLKISQEDILSFTKDMIRDQFARYGQTEMPEEKLNTMAGNIMENEKELRKIHESIAHKKLLEFFKNNFILREKPLSIDNFYKSRNV